MPSQFDHERLKVYQRALRFVGWASSLLEERSSKLAAKFSGTTKTARGGGRVCEDPAGATCRLVGFEPENE
jgi:hypothetical protein